MEKNSYSTEGLKFLIGWLVCFGLRLLPYRPPNIEPILTTTMPFAKKYGWLGGFVFGFFSIVLFDAAVGKVGIWTWITGATYGLLGVGAYFFFRHKNGSALNFLKYAVLGTILYDAATGLTIGPMFFGQTLRDAFFGQIPFTALHLLGNMVLSVTISPILYKWVVSNEKLEIVSLKKLIKI